MRLFTTFLPFIRQGASHLQPATSSQFRIYPYGIIASNFQLPAPCESVTEPNSAQKVAHLSPDLSGYHDLATVG